MKRYDGGTPLNDNMTRVDTWSLGMNYVGGELNKACDVPNQASEADTFSLRPASCVVPHTQPVAPLQQVQPTESSR